MKREKIEVALLIVIFVVVVFLLGVDMRHSTHQCPPCSDYHAEWNSATGWTVTDSYGDTFPIPPADTSECGQVHTGVVR